MMQKKNDIIITDGWTSLQTFTSARIALGRTGVSVPVKPWLAFKMAHAHAKDAVFSTLNKEVMVEELTQLALPVVLLNSKAANRQLYLQRPDLGRQLEEASKQALIPFANDTFDVCITIADGLSANAINLHAIPLLKQLIKPLKQYSLRIAPVCLVEGGRVAISDETGSLLQASLSLILIGERPGLSSPHSLSAYLTYAPKVGLTDERRNCVSNIRPEGMTYEEGANAIFYLLTQALQHELSGTTLKDNRPASEKLSNQ